MCRRTLLLFVALGAMFVFGGGTSGEAHRSGCHRWQRCPPHRTAFSGFVVRIKDGDTIEVLHQGKAQAIRLAGIDAPETRQAFGAQATQFTSALAVGKEVTVTIVGHHRDRAIGEVMLPDGRNLSQELVKAGLAWWYEPYARDGTLRHLEQDARNAKLGLWLDPRPIPPWEFRKQREAKP